ERDAPRLERHVSQTRICMAGSVTVSEVRNVVNGVESAPGAGVWFDKLRPADGTLLCRVPRSGSDEVNAAVGAAKASQRDWAARTPGERGELVREIALALRANREQAAALVVEETGKSLDLALGEADAAVEMAFFAAGEGRRLYGRTTTSAMP